MTDQETLATVADLEDLTPEIQTELETQEVNDLLFETEAAVADQQELQRESVTESEFETEAEVINIALDVQPYVLTQISSFDASQMLVYQLRISGTTYYAYFPVDSNLAVLNGYLVNMGSANVSGVLSRTGSLEVDSYNQYMLTIQPLLTTGSQSNAYRYGSRSYMTTYSPGTNNTLNSTNSYVSVQVLDIPSAGAGWDQWHLGMFVLLLALVIFNVIGAFLRR